MKSVRRETNAADDSTVINYYETHAQRNGLRIRRYPSEATFYQPPVCIGVETALRDVFYNIILCGSHNIPFQSTRMCDGYIVTIEGLNNIFLIVYCKRTPTGWGIFKARSLCFHLIRRFDLGDWKR